MSRATAPADYRAIVEAAAEEYGRDPGFLIPVLQDVQEDFGYLPAPALRSVAEILRVPLTQVYSATTFYRSLRLTPRGKHLITLCLGTVCYLKGASEIARAIQDSLNVAPDGTTDDLLFTFKPVNCLGACALAPVMMVDNQYFTKVRPNQVEGILAGYAEEGDEPRYGD